MLILRQGATHKVVIGPVVAVGDGFTPVTNLDVATADEAEAIKHDNGTVVDISGYTWAAIATADGYYHLTLHNDISGTVGHLTVVINDDSLCLPVRADFTIIEEAAYDAMYAASAAGPLQSTTAARKLDVSATGEAGLDFNNIKNATGAHTLTNITVPATTAVTNDVTADMVKISGGTTEADRLQAALGTGNYIAADVTKWLGTAPLGLNNQRVQVDVQAIEGLASAATVLGLWLAEGVQTVADSGTTTTLVDAVLTQGDDDWNGALLIFRSGTNKGRTAIITDFDAATDTLTFAPAVPDAVTTEGYVLVPGLGHADLIADTITDAKIADNAFKTEHFASSYYQDIAETANARPTWYVDGSIAASGDGTSLDTAFKTITEAVSAAASAGDLIKIGPGTYTEDVDLDTPNKSLEMVGAGPGLTIITDNNANTLTLEDYCTIRKMTVIATGTTSFPKAIQAVGKTHVVLEDVYAIGPVDAIKLYQCSHVRVTRCRGEAGWDGLNMLETSDYLVEDSYFSTDSTWASGSEHCRALLTGDDGIVRNAVAVAERDDATDNYTAAIEIWGTGVLLDNVVAVATHGASCTGKVRGISIEVGSTFKVAVHGGYVQTTNAGSGDEYHLDNKAGGILSVSGLRYDPTKTNGAILNLDERAVDAMHDRRVWHVDGDIAASGDGLTRGAAFKTIAEAVSAASSGDLIKVGPGTYTEAISFDVANKSIEMVGAGVGKTILTYNDGITLELEDYCTVRKMTVIATGITNNPKAIQADSKTHVIIEDVYAIGPFDALIFPHCSHLRLTRCQAEGNFDAVNLSLTTSYLIEDCYFSTDCTWNSGNQGCRGLLTGKDGIIRNTVVVAERDDATAFNTTAITIWQKGSQLIDVVALVTVGEDCTGAAIGISSSSNVVSVHGGYVRTTNAGSGAEYDLKNGVGGQISVCDLDYDPTKTLGGIIDLDERSVANVMDDAIPGSPTADSINQRLKAIDVLTEAGGDGDLAAIRLDAGTGARTVTVTVDDGDVPTPLESAYVRFTQTGGAGTYVQRTDASGNVTFSLDDGTYTVSISLIGYTYTPSSQVVDEDETPTYSMTAQTITAPGAVTLCTVQFNVKLGDTAVTGAVCKAKLLGVNQAADGTILSNEESSATTAGAGGSAELELVRKDAIVKGTGRYKIWVEIDGKPVASTETKIPNQTTAYFEDLL